MDTKQIAKVLLEMLSKQAFTTWYERDFEDYIQGEEGAMTTQQILNDLEFFVSREVR